MVIANMYSTYIIHSSSKVIHMPISKMWTLRMDHEFPVQGMVQE